MSKAWAEAKEERASQIGGKYCEICGRTHEIIGHHLCNRKYHRPEYEVPELCELRCTTCEQECHRLYRDGNRPEDCRRMAEYFKEVN